MFCALDTLSSIKNIMTKKNTKADHEKSSLIFSEQKKKRIKLSSVAVVISTLRVKTLTAANASFEMLSLNFSEKYNKRSRFVCCYCD